MINHMKYLIVDLILLSQTIQNHISKKTLHLKSIQERRSLHSSKFQNNKKKNANNDLRVKKEDFENHKMERLTIY